MPKILFLHGYAQSAAIYSAKTGALRKALHKLGYETEYVEAPYRLTSDALYEPSSEDVELYGWWLHTDKEYDISDSLDVVEKHVDDDVVGMIGFSQGAGLAGILSAKYEKYVPNLKFTVLYSGFKLKPTMYDEWYEGKIQVPTLHVLGELDTVVEEERSLKLWDVSDEKKRTMLKHQGGHFVPNSKNYVQQVSAWISNVGIVEEEDASSKEKQEIDDDLLAQIDNLGKV